MCMFVLVLVENSCLVEEVDAYFTRGVDDLLVAHDDAHMGDDAILIAEEGQIARSCFLQKIHQLAFFDLL